MKNYLIVGASSGIGRSLVNLLKPDGNHVYGTYFTNNEFKNDVKFQYYDVLKDNLDLEILPEVLDGLVYCPGSINLLPFSRIKPEEFIQDFRLQVEGAIRIIQSVLPRLKKSNLGSIVLFSTVAVQSGFNFHSQVATSKGAIEGLTRSLAAEFAPKIRVNAIAPSLTETKLAAKLLNTESKIAANAERHPLKRIGSVTDIAEIANFLLSEKSSWITGQIMHVDGGMSGIK